MTSSTAPLNFFVGTLLVVVVLSLALPAGEDVAPVFTAAGFLLFGLVYLYVGLVSVTGAAGTGVGWYCGWAAAVSLVIALVTLLRDGDGRLGTLWVLWALLFAMFFVVLGLGLTAYTEATGWFTVVVSVVTATGPGLLLLLDVWSDVPVWVVVAAALVAVVALVLGVARARAGAGPRGQTATAR